MRGRTAALALAGVLLLAGLVAMRSMLSSDDAAPPPPPPAAPVQQAQQVEPAAPAAPVAPAPVAPAARAAPAGPAAPSASSAPELPTIIQSLAPSEKKPPIANKALLREQVAAVAPQLAECAKQASFTGSGSAVLTYLVAPNKQKQDVSIESTGVEYDGTTIDNQPLLDCLKDTAKDMKFKYVPDTDGVFAFRRVKFEGGKLVENTFVDFHYVR
jgi:type IV secretory pathway VirB10-like protein